MQSDAVLLQPPVKELNFEVQAFTWVWLHRWDANLTGPKPAGCKDRWSRLSLSPWFDRQGWGMKRRFRVLPQS